MRATPDAASRLAYSAALGEAANAAGHAAGWVDRDLELGPHRIRLRFAGAALVPLLGAALRPGSWPPGGEPGAELRIWDSVSTGVPAPDRHWADDDVVGRGEVRGFEGIAQDGASGAVSVFDPTTRRGVLWVPDPALIPWYERAAPLRTLLNWALAGPSGRLVHAGAVGHDRAGALLAGPGGSGKSTLALACAQAGLGYAGDDYVFLLAEGGSARAFALYSTAKADDRTLSLLDGLARAFPAQGVDGEKAVLAIDEVRASVPLTAIVLPTIGGAGLNLRRVSGADALRALAPSTIFQLPRTASPLAPLAELVRAVPSYRLELGNDPGAAAALVAELLEA